MSTPAFHITAILLSRNACHANQLNAVFRAWGCGHQQCLLSITSPISVVSTACTFQRILFIHGVACIHYTGGCRFHNCRRIPTFLSRCTLRFVSNNRGFHATPFRQVSCDVDALPLSVTAFTSWSLSLLGFLCDFAFLSSHRLHFKTFTNRY